MTIHILLMKINFYGPVKKMDTIITSVNYSNNTEKQLTSGQWDVTKVYGYNLKKGFIFKLPRKSPTDKEIYS